MLCEIIHNLALLNYR